MQKNNHSWMIAAALTLAMLHLTLVPARAQAWAKKASKSVFTLKTFDADGTLIASSNGFFTSDDGQAVSPFAPFRGAHRAVIIDAQGKEMAVACMLGANDTYDVAKFRVEAKKTVALPIATKAAEQSAVWLLPYREEKSCPQGIVRKAETFKDDYTYYTLALTMPEQSVGCPLLNGEGAVVGLMQQPASNRDTLAYAVDAAFAASLNVNGLSINDATLRSTHIRIALPDDIDQANLTLYVASASLDSLAYTELLEAFISKFPDSPDGYTYRAQFATGADRFAAAAADMEQAIRIATKKDEAYYNYARLIYQKEIYKNDRPFADWSLDKAYAEAEAAYAVNPQPVYRQLQGQIRYAQRRYAEAADIYGTITGSTLRSADLFYEASRCQEMLRDTTAQLALLDSAVAMFSRPYLKEAAPYLFSRALVRIDAGRFREAVADLNEYEALMPAGLTDRFFYIRHQADVGGRLFQQGLDDINRAIELNPASDLYYAERASLQARVGQLDEAMASANECIRLAPDNSDGYLFLGLAQCAKGMREQGVANLRRAKELGDNQADALIEKYSK